MPEVVTGFQRNRVWIESKIRRKRILGFLEANGMLEHIRALEARVKRLSDVIDIANDGYHRRDDYPPFAVTSMEDRIRWSTYIQKIIAEILVEAEARVKEEGVD